MKLRTSGPSKTSPEVRDRLNKAVADFTGRVFQKEYNETSNPLFLFNAYQEYRRRKAPLPDWILNYFDDVAGSLLGEAANRADGIPGGERAGFTVYSILGMKGDVFNNYAKREKQLEAVSLYFEKRESHPEDSDLKIFMEIEDVLGKPYKTIEGWIRKHFTTT